MRLEEVVNVLCSLAPEDGAEDWDKVGLQVGDPSWIVRRGMLCIDLTEPVLAEAVRQKVDLIVAYHPPIFAPLPALTSRHWKQRLILEAAHRKIAIYSPHTALDSAPGGVNDWLCSGLGSGTVRPIKPVACKPSPYKLVTFVPHQQAEELRAALGRAGAGEIGDYRFCSFNVEGEGTFVGGDSTHPTVGQPGRLERVAEVRLEMLCVASHLDRAVEALREVHPYEEPAFDIYRLETPPPAAIGAGRKTVLDRPIKLATLVRRLKSHLGVRQLEVAAPQEPGPIETVAVAVGAGGGVLDSAGSINAFVTGEMRHHDILETLATGVTVVLAGHSQTERPYLPVYRDRILERGGTSLTWSISRLDTPPSVRM